MIDSDFLNTLQDIIEEHISDESFGVTELADKVGMSRSNLLRKVQKLANKSVSQFINQIRLENAMRILQDKTNTVSEVAFAVGFSSTSYFIKCFREYYGYPPGEVGKTEALAHTKASKSNLGFIKRYLPIALSLITMVLAILVFTNKPQKNDQILTEKSILVLPLKNDSNDSSNVYFINGLMESVLNNLQKINQLRVLSRTTAEKYRNSNKTIPEIGAELGIRYFVEGSGQKINDEILLNIQLIDAQTDNHLWAEQYHRKVTDVFKLQTEIAENIASKIQVIITPEIESQINTQPTENLIAYDYFLQGQELLFKGTRESLTQSITFFEKAIEHDNEFAKAYADLAIVYYYLDITKKEKAYASKINYYADKALLFNSKLPQSLVAKGLSYMAIAEYTLAVPFLEKALEYNPNSAWVINFLSDFYTNYIPNTEKYLEYALKGFKLNPNAHDSVSMSFSFLHLSNAFIQTGFVNQAVYYIEKSLSFNKANLYSQYLRAYILYAKNKILPQTKEILLSTFLKDTTRLDILQEIGKVCYYMQDYDSAYYYYKFFNDARKKYQLSIYKSEDAKIAYVLNRLGHQKESDYYLNSYKEYINTDKSIYKDLSTSMYFAYQGNYEKALHHLEVFSNQENYHYWTILFLKEEPLLEGLWENKEFIRIFTKIERNFWKQNKKIKTSLKQMNLI